MGGVQRVLLLLLLAPSLWAQVLSRPPSNVNGVVVKARSETDLTLRWNKISNFTFILRSSNGTETPIAGSAGRTVLTHKVPGLSPGTRYNFTLFSVFRGIRSSGFNFTTVTTPSNVDHVVVRVRSEIAVTLQWNKVRNSNAYMYVVRQRGGVERYTPLYWRGSIATHTVPSLSPGTRYHFTVYTLFGGERSSGYNISAVTLPLDVRAVAVMQFENQLELSWNASAKNISYVLRQSKTETLIPGSEPGSVLNHTVSSLSSGTKYSFTLYTVIDGVRSRGLNFSSVTGAEFLQDPALLASSVVNGLHCEGLSGGHSLVVMWDRPVGSRRAVEVQVEGRNPQILNSTRLELHGLFPAVLYNVTLRLRKGDVRGPPVSISCQTDPTGLIIGVVVLMFLLMFLCCCGVCLRCRCCRCRRRPAREAPTEPMPVEAPKDPPSYPVSTCRRPFRRNQSPCLDLQRSHNPYSSSPTSAPEPQNPDPSHLPCERTTMEPQSEPPPDTTPHNGSVWRRMFRRKPNARAEPQHSHNPYSSSPTSNPDPLHLLL